MVCYCVLFPNKTLVNCLIMTMISSSHSQIKAINLDCLLIEFTSKYISNDVFVYPLQSRFLFRAKQRTDDAVAVA